MQSFDVSSKTVLALIGVAVVFAGIFLFWKLGKLLIKLTLLLLVVLASALAVGWLFIRR